MKTYKILSLALILLAVNACIDEDPLFDPSKSKNVIEFYDLQHPVSPAEAPFRLFVNSYEISTAEEHTMQISYSGAHDNNRDIDVTLVVDPTALDDYNQYLVDVAVEAGDTLADGSPDYAHIFQYELMPASFYTGDMTVTIPKGSTKADVVFDINTTMFDFAKAYALPLRISSASSGIISGNYGAVIFNIGAKNEYHGVYHSTGLRTNFNAFSDWNGNCCPAGGTIVSTGPWNYAEVDVLTVNEFTNTVHVANSNGGFGTMNITVDTDSEVSPGVFEVIIAANGNTGVTNLVPMPGKVSTYDSVTKKYSLYYMYTNDNGTFRTLEHYLTLNE